MKKTVVAIGEILWDIFPEGKEAGGSSMNVALHMHKQGIESKFISAIGDDENGKDLLEFLIHQKFKPDLIQTSNFPTSTVQVKLDENKQATYTIVEPVAWDAIELTIPSIDAVINADAFVYCSLTCRNEKSKSTILNLLKLAKLKIFDINLREPFYNIDTLKSLLAHADILKVNEHELSYLKNELNLSGHNDEQLLKQLSEEFNIQVVCLTVGERGAYVLKDIQLYQHNGYPVNVADTLVLEILF